MLCAVFAQKREEVRKQACVDIVLKYYKRASSAIQIQVVHSHNNRIDKAMPRLIALLLVVTLVVGFQLQVQPSLAILGDDTCSLVPGQCPINTGTTPVCHYSQTSDSFYTTTRFCLYGSGLNGVSQQFKINFPNKIQALGVKANKNCKTGQSYNILQIDCSCEGECLIQADYTIKNRK